MRITHLTLLNYLNHRSLNVPVDPASRVLFVCGDNGAGKSGLAQALRLALTGSPVRGLQYKNQLSELITQGERDGVVAVTIEAAGEEHVYRLALRTGNYSGSSPALPGDPLALEPDGFIALDAPARRKLLFKLAGITLKPEAIVQELIAEGHTTEHVQRIASSLRQGFDAAAKEAQTAATEARGGWKAVTGETYGSTKAASWTASVPTCAVTEPVDVLQRTVNAAKATVEETRATHERLRHAATVHAAVASSQAALEALEAQTAQLATLQTQRAELVTEADALRAAASYKGGATCDCPACGTKLYWDTIGALKKWDDAKPTLPPPQAHTALQEVTQQLAVLERELAQTQQRVADGKAAQALRQNLPEAPEPGAVRTAEGQYQQAQAALALAQADLNVALNAEQAGEQAKARTAKAAGYHADVLAYTALADAITALPSKYLTSALAQVQALLDTASAALEQPVTLGPDMELRYGTIPYYLASESQQWRMRAAIGYALAVIGGLGVVVLDRFDQVQVKSRGPILKWLAQQQAVQVILCATLKELPKLPEPPFQLLWLTAP